LPTTATAPKRILSSELLTRLSRLKISSAQKKYLSQHAELIHAEIVDWLAESIRTRAKIDGGSPVVLAAIAMTIARKLRDKSAIARSLRTMGNAQYLSGNNKAAIQYHAKASKIFTSLGHTHQLGRTLNASVQPLILCGRYERALSAAEEAHRIFVGEKNEWRAARVDLNTGNILQRQGRYAEALEYYHRARDFFGAEPERDPEAYAVALHNVAMCLVLLNDFTNAQQSFQDARRFAQAHAMDLLAGQVDYNVATLHHLQGENTRAIEMLRSTREYCRKNGDDYHVALCQLDLSEIYLELNQAKEAEEMARRAAADFRKLGMVYEAAKSLANLALAMWHQGQAELGLKLFADAKRLFVTEDNQVWASRMDLYRAVILSEQKKYGDARRLSLAALKIFQRAKVPYSFIQCHLLLAHVFLQPGNTILSRRHCDAALKQLQRLELPALSYQAHHLMGRIRVAEGRPNDAFESYEMARKVVEELRGDLSREELRISFMKNRLAIYEELVELCMNSVPQPRPENAFEYIEQSKSRSLRDLVLNARSEFQLVSDGSRDSIRKVQALRAEIHSLSRQYEAGQLGEGNRSPKNLARIHEKIHKCEEELLRVTREIPLPVAEYAGLASPKPATIEEIRAALSPSSTLVEYFQIREQLIAAVLRSNSLEIIPVSPMSQVRDLAARLQFQLAKFRMSPQYTEAFSKSLMQATLRHLMDLHASLIAPLQKLLGGDHLLIIPHGALHSIPLQALFDGERYLIDTFKISLAPSASIFAHCQARPANRMGRSLVLGIPDINAPTVLEEVHKVAATIPESDLFIGQSATAEVLLTRGQQSRLIHIATHGHFRPDNPMFSGVRLGDGILSLYDLYQMKLPAELITLSGCGTGLNVVADGDELLGLLRGLIYAGAQAALLTLWDVQDQSTTEFMTSFYAHLDRTTDKSDALRQAMLEIREKHPHPYFWAPFFLVGKVTTG
jgi:CHAT domain-containing protein/Flp pilus assembly protein TadD